MRNRAIAAVLQRGAGRGEPQNPHMRKRNGSRGVTLIELCFGMAVVALLAGFAVPGFRSALRASAVRSATFELLTAVQQARASSIVQARTAVLCPSDIAGNCLESQLPAQAWTAFLEEDGRQVQLAAHALPAGVVLRATRSPLKFWPDSLAASTGTLTICDTQGIARPRAIVLSQSGRARLDAPNADVCRA
jgi:type IV fimbrial biogenesis protein FimT